MADTSRSSGRSLTIAQLKQIDALCDQFEADWRSSDATTSVTPCLRDYVDRVPQDISQPLFEQLLLLDIQLRAQRGNRLTWKMYKDLYSDYGPNIDEIFASHHTMHTDHSTQASQADATQQYSDGHVIQDPVAPILSGTVDRFRIIKELGRGSFGVVLLAVDEALERKVAIKVAHRTYLSKGEDLELKEARVAANLDHPAIVPVYESGRRDNGSLFVVSKWIDGTDLKEWMREFNYSVREAVALVATVADAAHYAHTRGLVHRDIKPANILIDAEHRPYLSDFGLALKQEQTGTGGDFVGTPAYMSPEQARCEGHLVDFASDIFSLGVVLFRLLYGRLPFKSSANETLLEAIQKAEQPDYSTDDPDINPRLQQILEKALARRAGDRHASARHFASELRAWLEGADRAAEATDGEPCLIVPRGLRPFTDRDALFFQRLVPGPRNRFGLPESIAFWKARIESQDQESAFRVGVLYGPSGTGKSSLMRAGVVPALESFVLPIFVTATPDHLDKDWLQAMRRQFPGIPADADLATAIRTIRDTRLGSDRKLLIVIDQFEQWLNAKKNGQFDVTNVVAALRQCDGIRVQALVLVRDDFYYDLGRCLAAAEVELTPQNTRAVDLFDQEHAKHVLAEFGTAYGQYDSQDPDHHKFVNRAVQQMIDTGDTSPVRLALFADVMKGRPWTTAELRKVDGVDGATSLLLDQIVSGESAHPTLKRHRWETGNLLRALLPPSGSLIKASPQSATHLSEASGLPQDAVNKVLNVLDREFKVVSPTSTPHGDEPHYLLSHDYLIPIVRKWSQRTHGETLSGRTELLLEDRTKAWQADKQRRNLPSPWEWLQIHFFTRRHTRSPSSRQMMSRAGWLYGGALAALLFVSFSGFRVYRTTTDRAETRSLVKQLSVATTNETSEVIDRLTASPRYVMAEIKRFRDTQVAATPNDWAFDLVQQIVAGGGDQALSDRILELDAKEIQIVCEKLLAHPERTPEGVLAHARALVAEEATIRPVIPCTFCSAATTSSEVLFHAAAAAINSTQFLNVIALLAQLDPQDAFWKRRSKRIVDSIGDASERELSTWIELLYPVRESLFQPTLNAIANFKQSERRAARATTMFEQYFAEQGENLATAVEYARPEDFSRLVRMLAEHDNAAQLVQTRLDALNADRRPENISVELTSATKTVLEQCNGFATPRFAIALSVPHANLEATVGQLANEGYLVRRCRPLSTTGDRFCVLWHKRPGKLRQAMDLTRERLMALENELKPSWRPIDVCVYQPAKSDTPLYCACWRQSIPGNSRPNGERIMVFDSTLPFEYTAPGAASPGCLATLHVAKLQNKFIFSAVERRAPAGKNLDDWHARAHLFPGALDDVVDEVNYALDFCFCDPPDSTTTQREFVEQLELSRPWNVWSSPLPETMRYHQVRGLLQVGRFREAHELLKPEIGPGTIPKTWKLVLALRVTAKLGEPDAEKHLDNYVQSQVAPDDKVAEQAISREFLGDDGLSLLKTTADRHPQNPWYQATLATAAAEIAGHWKDQDPKRYKAAVEAIIKLTKRMRDLNMAEWPPEISIAFSREIDSHPAIQALMPPDRLHVVHHSAVSYDQRLVQGDLLAQLRAEAREGFKPQTIAYRPVDNTYHALVYRRKVTGDRLKNLAYRKSRLHTALLKLGHFNQTGLTQDEPMTAYDMVRLSRERDIPEDTLWSLAEQEDDSVRYFSLLALTNFVDELSKVELEKVCNWYRDSPDAGVHSAARLLLDRCNQRAARVAIDQEQSGNIDPAKNWYVNQLGMTFVRVSGPIEFQMGSPTYERGRWPQSEILHRCRIPRSYWIAATELTKGVFSKYSNVAVADPSHAQAMKWLDGVRMCRWLDEATDVPDNERCYPPQENIRPGMLVDASHLSRTGHRLMTEAECEYAFRAGCSFRWHFGMDVDALPAFCDRETFSAQETRIGTRERPVAQFLPNRFGLFDTNGNLAEWCQDKFGIFTSTLGQRPRRDIGGPGMVSLFDERTTRGGHLMSEYIHTRSASRQAERISKPSSSFGIRVVRTIETFEE